MSGQREAQDSLSLASARLPCGREAWVRGEREHKTPSPLAGESWGEGATETTADDRDEPKHDQSDAALPGHQMVMVGSFREDEFAKLQTTPKPSRGLPTQSAYIVVEDADAPHDHAVKVAQRWFAPYPRRTTEAPVTVAWTTRVTC